MERAIIADLVDNLNFKLREQDIFIQLVKWEYLDSSMGPLHKQEEYNHELRDCELCLVLYWTRFGMYTKTELDTAYHELCAGRNPKKLYVYFKDSDTMSPELKAFRDSFPSEYGHFYCRFQNVDMLKADFLLQFMEYLNCFLKDREVLVINDSQVTINGKVFVNLQNIPFAGNNEEYNLLLKTIKKTKKLLTVTEPDDPEYAEYAAELEELEKKRSQMEASLWDTALLVTKLSTTHCSERLARAMELFGKGDNKGAQAILNEEEIEKDVQHNLRLIELGEEGKKGLKTNIDELRLKIQTLESEGADGWKEKVIELYERCVELGRHNLEKKDFAQLLSYYGMFLLEHAVNDRVEAVFQEAILLFKELTHETNDYFDVWWTLLELFDYYVIIDDLVSAQKTIEELSTVTDRMKSSQAKGEMLSRLGCLYRAKNEDDEAERCFKQAISQIGQPRNDTRKRILEFCLFSLAEIHFGKGLLQLAEKEAQEALKIRRSMIKDISQVGRFLYSLLGRCLWELKRYEESEPIFRTAVSEITDMKRHATDDDLLEKAHCLDYLAHFYDMDKKPDLLVKAETEALMIYKLFFDKDPDQYRFLYATTLNQLAWGLYTFQKPADAEDYASQALQNARDVGRESFLAEVLDTKACIERALGKYVEAESLFHEAIRILEQLKDDNEKYLARLAREQKEMAILYDLMGCTEESKSYLVRSKDSFSALTSESHIQRCAEDIEEVNRLINK